MRPGIDLFHPDTPWLNCHENFTHTYTPNASWQPHHNEGDGASDLALYKRATENLQWAIGEAIDNNRTLRAIGANWSFSNVAMCSGGMVQTKKLDLVFKMNDSLVAPWVATGKKSENLKFAECGVQISRLNKLLEIEINPPQSIKASGGSNGQTIAGATSTGTHGAALFTGAVHDAIVGIHIVTGRDTHVWLERESKPVASDEFITAIGAVPMRDDELFNAAVVSFGSFGIIHGIMLETEPLYLLKEYRIDNFVYSDELMSAIAALDFPELKALLPKIPDSIPGHELYHMEIIMNPYGMEKGKKGGMYLFLFYKVPVPSGFVVDQSGSNSGPVHEFIWLMKNLLNIDLGKLSDKIIKDIVSTEFKNNIRKVTLEPKTIGSIFRDTRFAGNIASFAFAVATSDLPQTIEHIMQVTATDAFAGAAAVRFVKGTQATLGFTHFPRTAVVEMDGLDIKRNHGVFDKVIERLIVDNIPFTIHWGKLNSPLNSNLVTNMYGDASIKSWKKSREKLLSTETRAVFTNEFMQKCGLDTPSEILV